jgi:hypothetical protein
MPLTILVLENPWTSSAFDGLPSFPLWRRWPATATVPSASSQNRFIRRKSWVIGSETFAAVSRASANESFMSRHMGRVDELGGFLTGRKP